MNPRQFAELFRKERDDFLGEAYLPDKIATLQLSPEQTEALKSMLGVVLTDVYFRMLCGLDGSASIGDLQASYTITDEHGNVVCNGDGTLEAEAWEVFHNQQG